MTDKPNGEALAKQDPMQIDKKKKTYIAVVLDSSGSMQKIKKEVIQGFNEHAATIRAGSGNQLDSKVCLMTFASYVNPPVLWCVDAKQLKDLTEESYKPDGMTAMLDCVGVTIDKLEEQEDIEDEQTAVLVLVVSDGRENNSRKETYPSIAERVQRLGQEHGTRAPIGDDVVRVTQAAPLQAETAAPDAAVQPITQPLQRPNLVVEAVPPGSGETRPVGLCGRTLGGEQRERFLDLPQKQSDVPRRGDEGQTTEFAALEPALTTFCSGRLDEAFPLVIPKGRGTEAAPLRRFADREQIRHRAMIIS